MEESQFKEFETTPKKNIFTLSFLQVLVVLGIFSVFFVICGLIQMGVFYIFSYDFYMNYIQPILWVIPFLGCIISYYFMELKPNKISYNIGFKLSKWYLYPIFILMFFGGMLINELLTELVPKSGLNGFLDKMYKAFSEIEKILLKYPISSAFMIVVLAPIFEEILFRGILLKGMINKGTNPYLAIVISALLFGIIHMNPWQFIGASFLGILLGFIYYKTQSIINAIILHFINNALGVFIYFKLKKMSIAEMFNFSDLGTLIFGLSFLLIFGFLFYHFTKNKEWKYY